LEQEPRRIGAPTHGVVARSLASTYDDTQLGNLGAGDGRDQLGTVLRDPARLRAPPDHESGDVLQKQQRNLLARAQLDEVRTLQGAFGEENTVVRKNPDWIAMDAGIAAHECRSVELLELLEL